MKSLRTRLVLSLLAAGILCVPLAFPTATSARPDDGHKTPLIYDFSGNGLSVCSSPVYFDIDGDGLLDLVDWPAAGSDDAFLAIDLNNDHKVTYGKELFSESAPQAPIPGVPGPTGFGALAYYDQVSVGGNGNGVLDPGDSEWSKIFLWTDVNHDAQTSPNEIMSLNAANFTSIGLGTSVKTSVSCSSYLGSYSAVTLSPIRPSTPRSTRMFDIYLRVY